MKEFSTKFSTFKSNKTWNSFHSNQKKAMITNSIEDLIFQPIDDEILSIDTLMKYVQGLMSLSERKVLEAEILKKGNEFYIDAIKGLIKSLNKEKGNANAVMNKLARQADEKMPVLLIGKNEEPYYSKHLKTTRDFIREKNSHHHLNHKEVLDGKESASLNGQSVYPKGKSNRQHSNCKNVLDVNEPVLLEVESKYPVEQ